MQYKPSWNVASIPDDVLYSEIGRRNAGRRKNAGGYREGAGRKPELVACPRCGEKVSKTAARRGHGCGGTKPRNPQSSIEPGQHCEQTQR